MTHRNASKHNVKIGKSAKNCVFVIVWKKKTTSKSNINIVESFSKRADVEEKKPAVSKIAPFRILDHGKNFFWSNHLVVI